MNSGNREIVRLDAGREHLPNGGAVELLVTGGAITCTAWAGTVVQNLTPITTEGLSTS